MKLFEPVLERKRLRGQLVWFLVWVMATVLGAWVLRPDPSGHGTHQQLGLPPCGSVVLFGRPCPGCGLTTSWTALLQGDWAKAWRSNLLGPVLYVAFTLSALACLYGWARGQRFLSDSKPVTTVVTAMIVVVLVFGGVRFMTTQYPLQDRIPRWLMRGENGREPTRVPEQGLATELARPNESKKP
jgi:hypothetical protein